jgi:hypothetical protein
VFFRHLRRHADAQTRCKLTRKVNNALRRCQDANARDDTRKLCRQPACPRGRRRNPSTKFVTKCDAFAWFRQSTPTKSLQSNTTTAAAGTHPSPGQATRSPLHPKADDLLGPAISQPARCSLARACGPEQTVRTRAADTPQPIAKRSCDVASKDAAALRLDQTIRAALGERTAPLGPPARAEPALAGGPARGARLRASMSVSLRRHWQGAPQKRTREIASTSCSADISELVRR